MKYFSFIKILLISSLVTIEIKAQQNQCDPGDPTPPCPTMPGCNKPNCDCKEQGPRDSIPVVAPRDPNEIIGPAGYDTLLKWVSVNAILPYKVLFENDPDSATAAARKVIIYVPLHPNTNPGSLRLGDFGFGPFNFTVPENTTIYTNRLDVKDSLGVFVDITAGLDITNRRAFWIFESIDPATGLASTLPPTVGFLPVNDSITHKGEGYVNFTVQPMPTALTRDTIAKKASIIFDDNEAIETNIEKNTIDAKAPQSRVTLATQNQDTIRVFWTGADDPPGCGIKDYALYVSVNNGPFALYKKVITGTDTIYLGIPGNTYCFYTQARDHTGNQETHKDSCEVTIGGVTVPLSWLSFTAKKQDSYVNLNWATANEKNTARFFVERSVDGRSFNAIGNRNAAGNSSVITQYNYKDYEGLLLPAPILYYRIKQTDRDGRFTHTQVIPINNKKPDGLQVKVYPNPFNRQITIEVKSNNTPNPGDRVEIYNNIGVRVYNRSLEGRQPGSPVTLNDLGGLANGVYNIKVIAGGEVTVVKVVKQ